MTTTQLQAHTHTYPVEGTQADLVRAVALLRDAGELVGMTRAERVGDRWRMTVTVTVRAVRRSAPKARVPWRLTLSLVAVGTASVAGSGFVLGAATDVGMWLVRAVVAGVVLYLAAIVGVAAAQRRPGHHCPGCPNH